MISLKLHLPDALVELLKTYDTSKSSLDIKIKTRQRIEVNPDPEKLDSKVNYDEN